MYYPCFIVRLPLKEKEMLVSLKMGIGAMVRWIIIGVMGATLVGCALAFWAGTLAIRLLIKG